MICCNKWNPLYVVFSSCILIHACFTNQRKKYSVISKPSTNKVELFTDIKLLTNVNCYSEFINICDKYDLKLRMQVVFDKYILIKYS